MRIEERRSLRCCCRRISSTRARRSFRLDFAIVSSRRPLRRRRAAPGGKFTKIPGLPLHNDPVLALRYRSRLPLDLRRTLAPLRRSRGDPTHVEVDGAVWRTVRAASGPATLRFEQASAGDVLVLAWGPGAEEAMDGVPDLLGASDTA